MKMRLLTWSSLLLVLVRLLGLLLMSAETDAFLVVHPMNLAISWKLQCNTNDQLSKFSSTSSKTRLQMSNQFDVSKPVFDLFSLRSVRGDALAKYSSLNQSEPLRINIWGLLSLTFFSSPWLSVELNDQALPLTGVALSVLSGIGCTGLFVRECSRRSKQLTRFEKELNALELPIRLPSNKLADAAFQQAQPLGQLVNKSSQTMRLLAISGTTEQLKSSLLQLRVLGRRLVQASTYLVVVPTDGSSGDDYGLPESARLPFVADPANLNRWREYFSGLATSNTDASSSNDTNNELRWFGISATGRSFASGQGSSPEWLQILGQHLRPTEILDESEPSQKDEEGVLAQQRVFYKALTEGNLDDMKRIYSPSQAAEVSNVVNEGGRLDEWKSCLVEDARPAGMKMGDADVVVASDTLAYSTIIEFPVTPGLEEATLLAVQTWKRANKHDEWKLELHQTIPWSSDVPAGGILLCDCRGCVALTRGPARRTFGGLVA